MNDRQIAELKRRAKESLDATNAFLPTEFNDQTVEAMNLHYKKLTLLNLEATPQAIISLIARLRECEEALRIRDELKLRVKLQKHQHSSADVSDERIKIKADTYGIQAPAFDAGAKWMRRRLLNE